jgi:histidinol-phosphate aminotransferase
MQFNKHLQDINIYEAGKPIELLVRSFGIAPENIIKMASNENPFGLSPKVAKVIAENSHKSYLYPDDSMFELKEGLSQKFDITPHQIIIGAGSDQILEFISKAILNPEAKVLMNKITFAMYSIYAKHQGATVLTTNSIEHDLEQFLEIYQNEKPQIIYICTPNNPTGDIVKKDDLFKFLEKIDSNTLVVVDGAYMEYLKFKSPENEIIPKELIEKFQNVIYLGTFSKAFGLGGLRVGYGIASKEIINNLYKVRPPFNITTLSLLGAVEALKDLEFLKHSIEMNFGEMEKFKVFLTKNKIKYINSWTNFITILFDESLNSSKIADMLLKKGIIIRDLKNYGLNSIRITIGKPEENIRFFEIFEEVLTKIK